jgi:hypothetical protein
MISAHTSPPQVGELPPEAQPDESFILPIRPLRRWREDSTSPPFMTSDQGISRSEFRPLRHGKELPWLR